MKTSTKVILIAGAWVLLTLFLIGQFSKGGGNESANARLDTVAGENVDLDGDGVVDEVVQEDATDVNGDGIIELGEGVTEGVASSSEDGTGRSSAGASGGSGDGSGTASGSSTGGPGSGAVSVTPGEPGSASAVPGAAPTSGSGGATATTSRPGGAASGSSGTTPTTTSSGSGSGGATSSTTTTTHPTSTTAGGGGGGGTTSSTSTPPTTVGGGGSPPPPNSAIILIIKAKNTAYEYPSGYSADLQLATGSQIRFDNIESTGVRHSFTIPTFWDSGEIKSDDGTRTSPAMSPGTYTYTCTKHPTTMRGTITVS